MIRKVVLEPSAEGGFTALVPSLPGCIGEGETRAQALESIREAIALYLEPLQDDAVAPASGTTKITPQSRRSARATKAKEPRIR